MQTLILTLHIIVCVLLVILVLLQAGKEGMGVIFGGGNTSVFGSSGAGGMLSKLTAFVGLLFIVTSLSYTLVTSSRPSEESAVIDANVEFEESAPAKNAPAAPATAPAAAKTDTAAPKTDVAPAKAEAPKSEATPAKDAAAPKADAPKTDTTPAKADAPKTEAPKADTPAAADKPAPAPAAQ